MDRERRGGIRLVLELTAGHRGGLRSIRRQQRLALVRYTLHSPTEFHLSASWVSSFSRYAYPHSRFRIFEWRCMYASVLKSCFPVNKDNVDDNNSYPSVSEPRACGRPEQPPNSTMTVTTASARNPGSAYEVGATVEYNCNAGSLLIGPTTRTCLDTGFYNEFPPVCKSKKKFVWLVA